MPITLKPPAGTHGAAWPAIAVGLFVAFGGVLFGYDTGTIGGILAMPYWLKEFSTGAVDADGNPDITASQKSMIVSLLVSKAHISSTMGFEAYTNFLIVRWYFL